MHIYLCICIYIYIPAYHSTTTSNISEVPYVVAVVVDSLKVLVREEGPCVARVGRRRYHEGHTILPLDHTLT